MLPCLFAPGNGGVKRLECDEEASIACTGDEDFNNAIPHRAMREAKESKMARTVVTFEGTHRVSHLVLDGEITRGDIREACETAWESANGWDVTPALCEAVAGPMWDKWDLRLQVIRDEEPVENGVCSICAPSYEYRYWNLGDDYCRPRADVRLLLCAEGFIRENKPSRVKVVRMHRSATSALFDLNRKEEEE